MSPLPHSTEEVIKLENNAHQTRLALLEDPSFVTGLESAIEDERTGRVMSLADFKRELDLA